MEKCLIHLMELFMGLIVIAGTICGALDGDIWAAVLFFIFTLHWIAGTLMSFRRLVTHDGRLRIVEDKTTKYGVYRRRSGGIVVLKGRKDVLERWARTNWIFVRSRWNMTIHWVWITTGTSASFASLACMVNMGGATQLAFLGMLAYASLAEIVLTVLAKRLSQTPPGGLVEIFRVGNQDKWHKSIIRSTLGVSDQYPPSINTVCRLDDFDWMNNFGLLPKFKVFEAVLLTLKSLNDKPVVDPRKARDLFIENFEMQDNKTAIDNLLMERIGQEIESVWSERGIAAQPLAQQVP